MFSANLPTSTQSQTPATNAPVQYRTTNNYATTFTGPIQKDRRLQDAARNDSMARAAYAGNTRQFDQQQGRGVQAGGKMAAYRAGMQGDAEASKAYAQAQQDMLGRMADMSSSQLQFQERLAGERGWVRDLILDRDDVLTRERMSAYKRQVDTTLGDFERKMKEAVAAEARKTEILGGLL